MVDIRTGTTKKLGPITHQLIIAPNPSANKLKY